MMNVLIVDDTQTIASILQVYLMGRGLTFASARDGAEGLRKARDLKPDLIITDVQMPVMDGFELCAAVRSDPALCAVPVLMLTGLSNEANQARGRLVGASAFLCKPIGVDDLRAQVSQLLGLAPG